MGPATLITIQKNPPHSHEQHTHLNVLIGSLDDVWVKHLLRRWRRYGLGPGNAVGVLFALSKGHGDETDSSILRSMSFSIAMKVDTRCVQIGTTEATWSTDIPTNSVIRGVVLCADVWYACARLRQR